MVDSVDPLWSSGLMRAAVAAKNYGEIVRLARRAREWTQAELGRRCSLSGSVISRLETGGQPMSDVGVRQAFCDVLAIPPRLLGLASDSDLRPAARPAAGLRRTVSAVADPVPAQLPADVDGFAGRSLELAHLDSLLCPPRRHPTAVVISAVSGTAGVGKTALAVHWAHQIRERFPDGQLYVNLRGFDPSGQVMDPADAVRGFLDALGADPQRLPVALEAQAALYRSLLNNKKMLVVLDNAHDTDQIRPLLPGSPGCLVIATSRNELDSLVTIEGARPLTLDLLTPAEAVQLLEHRLGPERVAAEAEAVQEIIGFCARLPLALAIVAARAAVRRGFSLAAIVSGLRDNRTRLDALTGGERGTDLRAVFSWSYTQLTPEAQRLFRLLSLHPGPDISAPVGASLAGVPRNQAMSLLAELTRAHLVAEYTQGRYGLHDLLRTYTTELTEN